jgi:autotransporter-associated beta strand protein
MEVSGFTLNPGTAVSANYTGNIANFARDMTLTKAGAGTQTLGGNNSYSGATTINNGVLAIGHANALGRGGSAGTSSGGTIVNSGGTLDLNGVSGVVEPIVLNGTGFGGNGALVNNSGTAASINAGIASLQITSGGTYGTSAPTVSISGTGSGASATVQFGLSAASLTSVTGGVNWAVGDRFTTTGGAGTEAVFEVTAVASGNPTAWTVISGGSGFTGAPTGITRLTKNPTGFAAGTFTFNSTNFAVAGLTLTNGGSGYDSASTATFSSGAATATVQHSSVVLASDSSIGGSGDISIGAVVSETGGSRALTKVGLGTLTLSAVNTYTGATTISGGALSISGAGSINSSTSVNLNGGTLRYDSSTNLSSTFNFTSGTISGTNWNGSLSSLTIGADRTISPGNSPGTATTGDQTWAGGGSYLWEINDATGTAGGDPGWDLLSGTGTLTITATDLSPFTILVTSLTLANLAGEAVNFADLTNYAWLVADFANPISDFSADAFSINTTGFGNTFTGTFGVARGDAVSGGNDTQLFLTYTPVPEPSTALLGGLGLLALLRRRR